MTIPHIVALYLADKLDMHFAEAASFQRIVSVRRQPACSQPANQPMPVHLHRDGGEGAVGHGGKAKTAPCG